MLLAKVVGNVVATVKDSGLAAKKLLVIQPVAVSGEALGASLVAIDSVGVGVGERVFYVRGKEASFPFLPDLVPADASIVGKIDAIETAEPTKATTKGSPS
jgi:microcompartment protein CcmK/EutM